MRLKSNLSRCALVFSALMCAAPASAGRITDYDLNKLDSWSDAIAVCDITRFLLTDPDLDSDAILVAGRDGTHVVLYRPLYAPPTNFFSETMRETFERVRKAGFVTADSYSRARLHYAQAMINAYRGATLADKRWLMDQMELCYHLAARAGVKVYKDR